MQSEEDNHGTRRYPLLERIRKEPKTPRQRSSRSPPNKRRVFRQKTNHRKKLAKKTRTPAKQRKIHNPFNSNTDSSDISCYTINEIAAKK